MQAKPRLLTQRESIAAYHREIAPHSTVAAGLRAIYGHDPEGYADFSLYDDSVRGPDGLTDYERITEDYWQKLAQIHRANPPE